MVVSVARFRRVMAQRVEDVGRVACVGAEPATDPKPHVSFARAEGVVVGSFAAVVGRPVSGLFVCRKP